MVSDARPAEHPAIAHNREAWQEIAATHHDQLFDDVSGKLDSDPTFFLEAPLRAALDRRGVTGKVVGQFNCNNGRELVSAVNYGAEAGVGFDIAQGYVRQARELARRHAPTAEFHEANVCDAAELPAAAVDLLLVTASAMCWIPDLRDYFAAAAHLVRPGGSMLLYETHPFAEMFKTDVDREAGEDLVPFYAYNTGEPVVFRSEGAYFGTGNTGATYWYHHSLSGIVTAALGAGFALTAFDEFDHDVCVGYKQMEDVTVSPPLSMLIELERAR